MVYLSYQTWRNVICVGKTNSREFNDLLKKYNIEMTIGYKTNGYYGCEPYVNFESYHYDAETESDDSIDITITDGWVKEI